MQGNVGGINYSPEKGGSFNVHGQLYNPVQINMISGGTSVVSMFNII